MDFFVTLLVRGVVLGCLYALIALGFVLVYKATGVLNFAVGEMAMFGGYLAAAFAGPYGLPLGLAIGLALLCMILFGVVLEQGVLRPMIGRPVIGMIMATLGLGIFLRGISPIIWGVGTKNLDLKLPDSPVFLGNVSIPPVDLVGVALTLALLVACAYFFQRTRYGIAMRAVSDDQQAAMAMGIKVSAIFAVAWALAGVAAIGGGLIWGNKIGVNQDLASLGLQTFPVVILGGLDSIPGTIIGGLVVGICANLAGGYLDPYVGGGLEYVAAYVLMMIVLLVRPYGLFGREIIEKV